MTVEIRAAQNEPAPGYKRVAIENSAETIYISPVAALSGRDIGSAELLRTREGPAVGVAFTKAGAEKLAGFMKEHKGRRMAILVRGRVAFAPPIGMPITDGKMLIGGRLTPEQATALVEALNAAAGR